MKPSHPPDDNPDLSALAADMRWATRCLSVIAAGTIGVLLYLLRPVLAPFVVALFLAVGLRPLLDLLQRVLYSRLAAVTVALLFGVALLTSLGEAVNSSIRQLADGDVYDSHTEEAVGRVAAFAEWWGFLPDAVETTDQREPAASPPVGAAEATDDSDVTAEELSQPPVANRIGVRRDARIDRLIALAEQGAAAMKQWLLTGMVSLSGSIGIVLIYMFFLLLGASTPADANSELWTMIEGKLREYIVLKTIISIGTGVAVWAVLAVFGFPLAVLMGLLTFLFNYIPNFGPLVTCVLPLPLIWLSPDSVPLASKVIASVLACGVQVVGGNVIEPRMMGSSFDLHPIVVLLALMAWYAIWGFVGMLLAVPITASIKVILERIDRTRPVARLMAGDLSQLQLGGAG